jgi:uncharacterized membrane protein
VDKRTYNFAIGVFLVIISLIFFVMPGFLNLDALIPFMFALASFIIGIYFFITGYSEK